MERAVWSVEEVRCELERETRGVPFALMRGVRLSTRCIEPVHSQVPKSEGPGAPAVIHESQMESFDVPT